jgi:hypothetical protein
LQAVVVVEMRRLAMELSVPALDWCPCGMIKIYIVLVSWVLPWRLFEISKVLSKVEVCEGSLQ